MAIDITVRAGVPRVLSRGEMRDTLRRALRAAAAPERAGVGLILTDDAELAALNERHMGRHGPTDVLSFPLLPPGAFPPHDGQDPLGRAGSAGGGDFVLPPGVPVHLGDIVISVERALAHAADGHGGQTSDVRWSGADELRLLIMHGALHLCGWDHADAAEEAAMRALERELLGAG